MRIPRRFSPLLLASFSIAFVGGLYGCKHVATALHIGQNGPMTEVSAEYADKNVETLLAHMRNAYESIKAATYTTESTTYNAEGGKDTYNAEFAFKKPLMIRGMLKGGQLGAHTLTSITDGETITVSSTAGPGQNGEKFTLDGFEKYVPVTNLESISFFDWDRQLSTAQGKNMANSTFHLVPHESWNGKDWIVLEETAKKDGLFVRYFIDPKSFLIWRTNVKKLDDKKDQLDAWLTKLDTNAQLDDALFKGT
jgi:hypothetical protein